MFKEINYVYDNKIFVSLDSIEINNHTWENETISDLNLIESFYDMICDDFVILDIGAQSGCFSLLSKFFPNTEWYSFEPDPTNYELLIKNLELNNINNVNSFNVGISNKIGNQKLKILKNHRGLNNYGENLIRFRIDDPNVICIETPVDTIDNLFYNKKIDLIKIDSEGSEFNILEGGKDTLIKYKPKILLEYYEPNLNQFNKTFKDLHNLFDDLGYQITKSFGSDVLIESKFLD